MEVTSFVSPKAVPQFSDAEAVARAALALPHLDVSALIPNLRGFERAREAGVRRYTVVIGATDRFNERNVRMTVTESLEQLDAVAAGVRAAPGATGNIATEDVNHMLQAMDIETGIDQQALLECGRLVRDVITAELASHSLRVHLGRGA